MNNLPIGVAALSRALTAGELSSVEATREYLARIDRDNPRLRAYVHVAGDAAFAQAEDADERRRKGRSLGPLDGVPIAAKDNIDIAGMPTAGGFDHYRSAVARQDAFVIQTLRKAGAVLLGKLNMHEGALGATTDNPWFGRCENPLRAGYTPGGSSGGSGSATAGGLAAGTLGSDTLGSVRIPAAYCGVTGIKPTYGLLSTRGVMPISWTLDHVGFLAPHVEDLRLLLGASVHYDRGWPHSRKAPYSTAWIRNHDSVCGLRVGTIAKFEGTAIEPEILAAYEASQRAMAAAGADLVEVRLPGYDFTRVRR
ncbi:MAG: amidase, partial [Burkholderiales bacterium]